MRKTASQIADEVLLKCSARDITTLADKWSQRDHLRIALREHLKDTKRPIGKKNEQKELTDLAFITNAYMKSQIPKKMQRERWKKFQSTAPYPSLAKTAGYYQNVVGFDDPDKIQALRDAGTDYIEDPAVAAQASNATRQYYKDFAAARREAGLMSNIPRLQTPKDPESGNWFTNLFRKREFRRNPEHTAWAQKNKEFGEQYREENPEPINLDMYGSAKLIGGTPYGDMSKYTEIPGLYPYADKAPWGGGDTGVGYLGKEKLLARMGDFISEGESSEMSSLRDKIKASPHRYFTSTEAG